MPSSEKSDIGIPKLNSLINARVFWLHFTLAADIPKESACTPQATVTPRPRTSHTGSHSRPPLINWEDLVGEPTQTPSLYPGLANILSKHSAHHCPGHPPRGVTMDAQNTPGLLASYGACIDTHQVVMNQWWTFSMPCCKNTRHTSRRTVWEKKIFGTLHKSQAHLLTVFPTTLGVLQQPR